MFHYVTISVILAIAFTSVNAQKNPNYADNRTTMVHLFEWKWNDIADECERFLAPIGYGGVQVSPITENLILENRPWYERYQPISYTFDTRSGTEEEFRSMVKRCNDVGVRIFVDILLNHMSGNQANATGTAGSTADTYDRDYPAVPYTEENFHSECQVDDYDNATNVRDCELDGLHDLDQSQEYVRDELVGLMNKAIDIGVAGFRIDAAKHIWPEDLAVIYSRLNNLNVSHGFAANSTAFIYQEVTDYGDGEAVTKYEYNDMATVLEVEFYWEICNALDGRNQLKWFVNWGEAWGLLPSSDALVFIDNHDTQRYDSDNPLTYKSPKLYRMAVAFMLAHPYGIPQVMSSFNFTSFNQGPPASSNGTTISPTFNADGICDNGWVCEHRWPQIYNMVRFRNYVGTVNVTNWWDNDNYQIAFCRGDLGFFAMNDDTVDLNEKLQVCLPAGVYCDVISGALVNGTCTGKSIEVDENGEADIEIGVDEDEGVLAIYAGAKAT